jgi:hypothetical protein
MEPENRPYVDADTKPGDGGTGAWADTAPGAGDQGDGRPQADPVGITDDGVVEGSPADEIISDAEAIGARHDEGDRA